MDELDGDAVQPDHGHDYPTHKKGSYCELMFALRPEARGEGTKVGGKCSGEKRKAVVAAVYTRAR